MNIIIFILSLFFFSSCSQNTIQESEQIDSLTIQDSLEVADYYVSIKFEDAINNSSSVNNVNVRIIWPDSFSINLPVVEYNYTDTVISLPMYRESQLVVLELNGNGNYENDKKTGSEFIKYDLLNSVDKEPVIWKVYPF